MHFATAPSVEMLHQSGDLHTGQGEFIETRTHLNAAIVLPLPLGSAFALAAGKSFPLLATGQTGPYPRADDFGLEQDAPPDGDATGDVPRGIHAPQRAD